MSKYINQLPHEVRMEIAIDAIVTLGENSNYSTHDIVCIVHDIVMNEKLINIIGSEEGLLSYDKYSKYL